MQTTVYCDRVFSKLLAASLILMAMAVTVTAQSSAPQVTKVEPPSWWAGHSINPVRLLLRGENLAGARVNNTTRHLLPLTTTVNQAGTYAFVDLRISPRTPPGNYKFTLDTVRGKAEFSFRIERPLDARANFQGITNDDVIYLIMPDRFANGDTGNDRPADSPAAANDRKNSRGFHGGDLRGIINRLPYLKDLGITALWLTPWYDNWNGVTHCDKPWCPHTYYHGYHAIDYYAVEDRFGDMATLRELVDKAHGLGIKLIQDQVANHVGSRHPWIQKPPLPDWFHGTLENHQLNRFNNSTLLSPHANRQEARNTIDGWFNDDLPDMNQEQPEVAQYEIQNSLWWVGITGIDGIRQDTIQYMPRFFIRQLSDALHREYKRMWMVGEVFERDAAQTSFFIGGHTGWDGIDTHLDSVFDFPLWQASLMAFTRQAPMRALRDQLKYDALYPDPAKLTTLQNNHDTPRFMSLKGATLDGAMMHMAFILSMRGTPQIYYGEEIAMEGHEDPDNRRDFPGGWPGDARNAFEASGRTGNEQRMHQWTRDWIRLRRTHAAIRQGKLTDLYYDDDSYVFARQHGAETVIIAFNRADNEKKLTLPASAIDLSDNSRLEPLLNTKHSFRVDRGVVEVKLAPKTAAAFIHKSN